MTQCSCCNEKPGTVREWDMMRIATNSGVVTRRVPRTLLCDVCDDGQYPYYQSTPDGGAEVVCPHEV